MNESIDIFLEESNRSVNNEKFDKYIMYILLIVYLSTVYYFGKKPYKIAHIFNKYEKLKPNLKNKVIILIIIYT